MRRIKIWEVGLLLLALVLNACSGDTDSNSETTIMVSTSDFAVTMDENPSNGQVIGTVQGTTNQGSVIFSIAQQTPSGAFAIESTTGELTVLDASKFDFEQNEIISGVVQVANGTASANASVSIQLNDVLETNIYYGSLVLENQEQVDHFGAQNYTEIEEDLVIGSVFGDYTINDLSPLSSLQSVSRLIIAGTFNLESLHGLHNLTSCSGVISISVTPQLQSLEELSGISETKEIYISQTNVLTSLYGLHNISGDLDYLYFVSNDALDDIGALSAINSVQGYASFSENTSLENLNGLSGLTSVGKLNILDNSSLTNLDGLTNLVSVSTDVTILDNWDLTDLCGLQTLLLSDGLGGDYNVDGNFYNPSIQDIIAGNCSL